nr:type II toxin-antitoxin system RelE/ParE family toxin [Rhizobium laguerreae]
MAKDNPMRPKGSWTPSRDAGKKLGEFATGRPGRITGTYEKSLTRLPYIISYELRSIAGRESVVILRVIHTARDWPAEE